MKIVRILPVLLLISNVSGLEIQPDSLSFTVELLQSASKALDTVTLFNNTDEPVQIDTVFIRFLNGTSADDTLGKSCDSADWNCYNYRGWSYGMGDMSLRFSRDSLFILQDKDGTLIRYTLQAKDSLNFLLQVISNCPVCGRMPSFPATTKYRYSFVTETGEKTSFLLILNEPTAVFPVQTNVSRQLPERSRYRFTLSGQKIDIQYPVGMTIRNGEAGLRVGRDKKGILTGK